MPNIRLSKVNFRSWMQGDPESSPSSGSGANNGIKLETIKYRAYQQ